MIKVRYEDQILYHYTSLEAIKSIIENRTIRLTDYRFLNDPKELKSQIESIENALMDQVEEYHIQILKIALENLKRDIAWCWEEVAKTEKGEPIHNPFVPTKCSLYVLSMTDRRDDLALWTSYGKLGCCVKFNHQKLFEFFDEAMEIQRRHGIMNFYRGKVDYNQRLFGNVNALFEITKIEGKSLPLNVNDDIRKFCILSKDKAYEYESEYRVCMGYLEKLLDGNAAKKVFTIKDGYLKPQIELPNFPVEDIIEEIIISPFNNSDCALIGLKEFVDWYMKKNITIINSGIKIR